MATLAQIRQALDNPNTRKMLNLIAASEGVKHGYNTLFGNQQFSNLSAHPNQRKEFTQTDGSKNYTTAAGRYQFINGTWQNLAKRYGFRSFSPMEQDLGAVALIAGRGALDDVLNGRWESAIGKLGKEWASLPSSTYKQGKRSWDFVNKQLGQNVGSDVTKQQKNYTLNFVDLNSLGYKPQKDEQFQPSFVDLSKLGYQESTNQEFKPQFVDLNTLGYKG